MSFSTPPPHPSIEPTHLPPTAGRPPVPPSSDAERLTSRVVSWTVILVAAAVLFALNQIIGPALAVQPVGGDDPVGLQFMRAQSRLLVGQNSEGGASAQAYRQAYEMFYTGPILQRLHFAALAGELRDAQTALDVLDDLEGRVEARDDLTFNETEARLRDTLRALYTAYLDDDFIVAGVSVDDREHLRAELDWLGELALSPSRAGSSSIRDPVIWRAQVMMWSMLGGVVLIGLLAFVGFIGLVVFSVFAFLGRIRSRLGPPLPYDHIYVETFAVWMVLLFGVLNVAGLLPVRAEYSLLVTAIGFFASLSALGWPILRGVPAGVLARDIGVPSGRVPIYEPLMGVAAYIMTLPLLAIGLAMVIVLMAVQALFTVGGVAMDPAADFTPTGGGPAHPIIEFVVGGNILVILQVYLVASVAAPIVEETMFRGVLYRHLRSSTGRWAPGLSILFSALFNSFIFAIIHPQPWVATPALMALAIGMTLAREYRGWLIAPMVMHSLSNALVVTLMFSLLA